MNIPAAACRSSISTFTASTPANKSSPPAWNRISSAPRGVTVVEWVERWLDRIRVALDRAGPVSPRAQFKTLGETEREITYEDFGG